MGKIPLVIVTGAGIPGLLGSIALAIFCFCMCKYCKHLMQDREPPPPDPARVALVLQAERAAAQRNACRGQQETPLKEHSQSTPPGVPSGSPDWAVPPPYPPDGTDWIAPPPGPPPPGPSQNAAPAAPTIKPKQTNYSILNKHGLEEPIPLPWPEHGILTSSGTANVETPSPGYSLKP